MSSLGYATACLKQGMSYQGAAKAAGINESDLRRLIPRPAAAVVPIEDDRTPFEQCAPIITDADAKECRKIAALAIALLCEKVGSTAAQNAMVNIALALPVVRATISAAPVERFSAVRISGREIVDFVADRFGLTYADMCSVTRTRALARPRQIAMFAVHHLCPHMSYPAIGRLLGGRDHTTILHGVRLVTRLSEADPGLASVVRDVIQHFASRVDTLGRSPLAEAIRFRRLCDEYGAAMRNAA